MGSHNLSLDVALQNAVAAAVSAVEGAGDENVEVHLSAVYSDPHHHCGAASAVKTSGVQPVLLVYDLSSSAY